MSARDKNWGLYFKQLFEEGRVFTEELLKDNERLRQRVALLEHERGSQNGLSANGNAANAPEVDTVRRERDGLRYELEDLKGQLRRVEADSEEFANKYVEIERQNSAFASLYVASYQLHSTLDFEEVLDRINEVVINLVGAEHFGVFLYEAQDNAFVLVAGESVESMNAPRVPLGDNLLTHVARQGKLFVNSDPAAGTSEEQPLAAMPLMVADELVGVLVIYKLLVQKDGFETVDMELFDLLGAHAATAIMAARLYSRTQRKASTLESFLKLLKEPGATPTEERG